MNQEKDFEMYCQKAFTFEKFQAELSEPQSEFYWIKEGGDILAYLKLNLYTCPKVWTAGPALQIERIYVQKNLQSAGIGKQLIYFSEQRAIETGVEWVWLSVWQAAPRSVAFYERNGYSICGDEVFVVGTDPQMDWLMRKKVMTQTQFLNR